jgi:hypothetical protein
LKALAILTTAICAWTASPAFAQCDGKPGWVIDAPDTTPIGSTVHYDLSGPANDIGFFMVSLGQGPLSSPYGTICLDFPLVLSFVFTFDSNGQFALDGNIPCEPALVDLTIYTQFITCGFISKLNKGASNQHALTITDGICDGDLCSYTQGGWGTKCSGNNAGCLRDKWFDTVFPSGLTIGDADGVDGDGEFALVFTSSAAVQGFLPASGTPDVLDADATDPTDSSAGEFAGQLVAAKLNVAFDDAGALDDCKGRDDLDLGDLVFIAGVDSDLIGWNVDDVIGLADAVISGALGAGPFDLDGNGSDDVTTSDISAALNVLNNNFDNGTQNDGNLGIP